MRLPIDLMNIHTSNRALNFFSSNALPKIQSANDFRRYNRRFKNTEEMVIVFFYDADRRPVGHAYGTRGSGHVVDFPIRDLVQLALDTGSWSMLITHNHPSENATPSVTDISKTRDILKALQPLQIILHDHIIYTVNGKFSFKSHGLI